MANHDHEESSGAVEVDPSLGTRAESLAILIWLGQLWHDVKLRTATLMDGAQPLAKQWFLGRFRLEALLGTGGYGAVFRAFDSDANRYVALKLAWPVILVHPEAIRRFVEEPKTVAGIAHQGIVKILDYGAIGMAHFIAFELVEGPTLAQWLVREGPFKALVACEVIRAAAEIMQFAHSKGVIHRDLKPSNLLLRPTEGLREFPFELMVTDFGLAHRPPGVELSFVTGSRAILGTDPYLSPEQAGGSSDSVQAESDIFSLGVILYELVAGTRPFDGQTAEHTRGLIRQKAEIDWRIL